MERVRIFIWDLDETVWFHLKNQGKEVARLLKVKDKETFAKQYSQMWRDFMPYFKSRKVSYKVVSQYVEGKIPILKAHSLSGNDFLEAITEGKKELEEINPEAIEVMVYLKEKGYGNISITDWFASNQESALEALEARSYIDKVYGCDDGYMKNNHRKISQMAKELQLESKKEEYIMVGDSLTSDIFFANALGIKSIWYNRKKLPNTTSYIPTLEVSSLLELKKIF